MLPERFNEKPLSHNVMQLIGEFLEEDKNRPVQDSETGRWIYNVPLDKPCDRNLIRRTLDMYRAKNDYNVEYCIYNIVSILKKVRVDLSGENFSSLDLRKCNFNGSYIGRSSCGANFSNSILNSGCFFPIGHADTINDYLISHDSTKLVTASDDCLAKMWDVHTGALIGVFKGHLKSINSIAISFDDQYVITASDDKTICVWDSTTFEPLKLIKTDPHIVSGITFDVSSKYIFAALWNGDIDVWNAHSYSHIKRFNAHLRHIDKIGISSDGQYLFSLSCGEIKVWDISTLENVAFSPCDGEYIHDASWIHNSRSIVFSTDIGFVKTWDFSSGELRDLYWNDTIDIKSIAFNQNSHDLTFSVGDNILRIVKTTCINSIAPCSVRISGKIKKVVYSHDGKYVISLSNNSMQVWNAESLSLCYDIGLTHSMVKRVVYDHKCKRLLSFTNSHLIYLWNTASYELEAILEGHTSNITDLVSSTDDSYMISASKDKTVCVWDSCTNTKVKAYYDISSEVISLFTPHKQPHMFYSLSENGTIQKWNLQAENTPSSECYADNTIFGISFDPECRYVLTLIDHSIVELRDITTFDLIKNVFVCHRPITKVKFSPCANYIYAESLENYLRVINFPDLTDKGILRDTKGSVTCASCSDDERYFAIVNNTNKVFIWDIATRSCINELVGHSDKVTDISFCNNGYVLATASTDGSIKVWNFRTSECLDTIPMIEGVFVIDCNMTGISKFLTDDECCILSRYGAVIK